MDMSLPREAAHGRYRLESLLGQGGTGEVFKARDTQRGLSVAFKRIRSSLSKDGRAANSFIRAVDEGRKVQHASLLSVLDCSTDEEGLYLVCEVAPLGSVADRLERTGPLTQQSAVSCCLAIGEALSALHEVGLSHRNVKPSNVLLFEGGCAKLSDLGTAALIAQDEMTLELAGSPDFMAPEQHDPDEAPDPRTDVYGLAATLHTCLTAEPPGGSAAYRVPPKLRPVLSKAMAGEPARRYASVKEFCDELKRCSAPKGKSGLKALVLSLVLALIVSAMAAGFYLVSGSDSGEAPVPTPRETIPHQVFRGEAPVQAEAKARLTQAQTWPDSIGSGYTLAFVENTGEVTLEKPRVDISYFDPQGREMTSAFGFAMVDLIAPGDKSPIKVLIKQFPKGFASIQAKLHARAPYSSSKRSAKLTLAKAGLQSRAYGQLELIGQLRSEEASAVIKYAEAIVVLFDAEDRIIDVSSGYATRKELAPGETSEVRVGLNPLGDKKPLRFEAWPDAQVYDR